MMDKPPTRIDERAAAYLARRMPHGKPPPDDDLERWLRADSRHADAYERAEALWRQLDVLQGDAEMQSLRAADLAALRRAPRWFAPGRVLAAAAALLLLLGGGYLLWTRLPAALPPPVGYATALGEQRTERLVDGTQVVMNTDSALQARYSRKHREVELKRGEVQFDVTHDAARPFVVRIGGDIVTALGTRFQVRREADTTVVTLLEGRVEIAHGQARRRLQPRQQARLSVADGIAVQSADIEQATGWLEGWLRFRGTPLREVIAEANRYSERKMRLGDPALAEVEFDGNFRAGDTASIAAAAALILPVRVEDDGGEIVLQRQ